MNIRGPKYKTLNVFVGTWKTQGKILATGKNPEVKINGQDIYEWMPGGFFLIHQVKVLMGTEMNETIEIIGFDKVINCYTMHHFDNKGNSGQMKAFNTNDDWTFEGESLRFKGRFSENGNILSGIWEQLIDGKNWSHYMDISLIKES